MWLRVIVACVIASHAGVVAAQNLSPADLARKSERSHVTGLPIAAYSIDYGLGLGARGYYYWNGTRDDPRFATTPYLARVFLNVFATSGGLQYHWLDLDAPAIAHSPYRIRSQIIYARNTDAHYYGFDDEDRTLHFPGAPGTFDSYDDYVAAQRRIAGGMTYSAYDRLDAQRPQALASIERSFFGNRVRVLGGLSFAYTKLRDYTGAQVPAVDDAGKTTTAVQVPTRFREDCDAGELVGCAGGRDHVLRLGLSYDTRDFEPDPNCGVYGELTIDLGTVALGSEYDYARLLFALRGFWSPFPDKADLVLAGRVMLQTQTRGTPFFDMSTLSFVEDMHHGLGGHRSMRGFRQDRFVDHLMTASSAEVRWTFWRLTIKRQKFAFIAVPFADIGRSFDSVSALSPRGWRPSAGGALRVSWNLATLGTLEYGVSGEGTGIYANFGHMF